MDNIEPTKCHVCDHTLTEADRWLLLNRFVYGGERGSFEFGGDEETWGPSAEEDEAWKGEAPKSGGVLLCWPSCVQPYFDASEAQMNLIFNEEGLE